MNSFESSGKDADESIQPKFTLRKMDWEKRLAKSQLKGRSKIIQRVAINSNVIVIGVSNGVVIRWKLNDTKDPEEIELNSKPEDSMDQLFTDPSGHHVIVGMRSGDIFYLGTKLSKPKKLTKVQGNIESAAFDKYNTSDLTTKSILIGTSLGAIYEIVLDNLGKEKFFQLIYQLPVPISINSIYYEPITTNTEGSTLAGNSEKLYVLFSTDSPTRLYHLVGGPTLHQIFIDLAGEPPFIELPGETPRAELVCYSKSPSPKADHFALLSGAGIYNGSLKDIRSGYELFIASIPSSNQFLC
jgi:hypothetical protein